MLHTDIKNKIKESMMAKDAVALEVYRGMTTAFMNELVAKGKTPQDMLTDEEATAVIMRLAKQRKDSIEQFEKAGREDLVAEEKAQFAVIEKFLPTMMSEADVRKIVEAKKAELGVTDASGKGKLMAEIMKELKGKADGMVVKQVVDSLF